MARKQSPDELVERALQLSRTKQNAEALAICSEVLKGNPTHLRGLFVAGICRLQSGDPRSTVELLSKLIKLSPNSPRAYLVRGAAFRSLGQHDGALLDYDRAASLEPKSPDAHFNAGNVLRAMKRLNEAAIRYETALQIEPERLDAMNNLAGTLTELGDWAGAEVMFGRILERGVSADILFNLGVVKSQLGRFEQAIDCFTRSLELRPDYAEAFASRSNAYASLGDHEQAVRDCQCAISFNPALKDAYVNMGKSLAALGRYTEALAGYDRALELEEDFFAALYNRGMVLRDMGRVDEARMMFHRLASIAPKGEEEEYTKAHVLLYQGVYEEGFRLYKSRWKSRSFKGSFMVSHVSEWDGAPFPGRLLLWAEQGIGDEIFYSSLLSLIPRGAMKISLAADRRLHPVFARSLLGVELIDRSKQAELIASYDAQAPIADLGRLLGVDAEKIAQRRYPFLESNQALRRSLHERLRVCDGRPLVGISWRSVNAKTGRDRSVELAGLAPGLAGPGVRLVSLQYGDTTEEVRAVKDRLGCAVECVEGLDAFNDLDGLLALIDVCDVVVTIDNVTAHLAGSIGKKTLVMVPSGRGEIWYWQGSRVSSWYPSIELMYQKHMGEWDDVVREVRGRLGELLYGQK